MDVGCVSVVDGELDLVLGLDECALELALWVADDPPDERGSIGLGLSTLQDDVAVLAGR